MIHPLGVFRIVWDLAMLCFVCYITLTMPYQLAFKAEPKECSWAWPAKTCEPVAVFDEALDWLEENRPEPQRLGLVWGDAKLGNVLYDPETRDVAAVIDWELATIGDTGADLASLRVADLRAQDGAGACLEGTPSEAELIELYEQASGHPVQHFHYQLVYSTFWRGSVALKVMTRMKDQGADIDDDAFANHFPVRYLRELLARG